jgi:hypothetical protein
VRTPGSTSRLGYNLTKRLRAAGVKPGTPLEVVQKMGLLPSKTGNTYSPNSVKSTFIRQKDEIPKLPALPPKDKEQKETDVQIAKRLKDRFEIMDKMTQATVTGVNRALIISGPPGLGKSHTVFGIVDKEAAKGKIKETIVRGFVRSTGLYRTFYENSKPNAVIVFDDADSLFYDDVSLNLLKIACDTTSTRRLSWLAEIRMTTELGLPIPRNFVFEGHVIFITNIDFETLIKKGHKLAPHLEALISRTHYLDLGMKTRRDYIVRIKQVLALGMLRDKGINPDMERRIMHFITFNLDNLRELSLRTVLKASDLVKAEGSKWEEVAKATLLR